MEELEQASLQLRLCVWCQLSYTEGNDSPSTEFVMRFGFGKFLVPFSSVTVVKSSFCD